MFKAKCLGCVAWGQLYPWDLSTHNDLELQRGYVTCRIINEPHQNREETS